MNRDLLNVSQVGTLFFKSHGEDTLQIRFSNVLRGAKLTRLIKSPHSNSFLLSDGQRLIFWNMNTSRYLVLQNGKDIGQGIFIKNDQFVLSTIKNSLFMHSRTNCEKKRYLLDASSRIIKLIQNQVRNQLILSTQKSIEIVSLGDFKRLKLLQSGAMRYKDVALTRSSQEIVLLDSSGHITILELQRFKLIKKCYLHKNLKNPKIHLGPRNQILVTAEFDFLYFSKGTSSFNFKCFQTPSRVIAVSFCRESIAFLLTQNDKVYSFSFDTFFLSQLYDFSVYSPLLDIAFDQSHSNLLLLTENGRIIIRKMDQAQNINMQQLVQKDYVQQEQKQPRIKRRTKGGSENELHRQAMLQQINTIIKNFDKNIPVEILSNYFKRYGKLTRRQFIWPALLQIPQNIIACDLLKSQSVVPQVSKLLPYNFGNYSSTIQSSKKTGRRLNNVLKMLLTLNPDLRHHVQYLAKLILTFYQLIVVDFQLFQFILSILNQWMHLSFDQKRPTHNLLNSVFSHFQPQIVAKFKSFGIQISDYLIDSYRLMMSDLLDDQRWVRLMDFIILKNKQPITYPLCLLAFFSFNKKGIMAANSIEQLHLNLLLKKDPPNFEMFQLYQLVQVRLEEANRIVVIENRLPLQKSIYITPRLRAFRPQENSQQEERLLVLSKYQTLSQLNNISQQLQTLGGQIRNYEQDRLAFYKERSEVQAEQTLASSLDLYQREKADNDRRVRDVVQRQRRFADKLVEQQNFQKSMVDKLTNKMEQQLSKISEIDHFRVESQETRRIESQSLKRAIGLLKVQIARQQERLARSQIRLQSAVDEQLLQINRQKTFNDLSSKRQLQNESKLRKNQLHRRLDHKRSMGRLQEESRKEGLQNQLKDIKQLQELYIKEQLRKK